MMLKLLVVSARCYRTSRQPRSAGDVHALRADLIHGGLHTEAVRVV
jgi:hypothetical protein